MSGRVILLRVFVRRVLSRADLRPNSCREADRSWKFAMAFLALLVVASYPEVSSHAVPNQSNPYGVTVPGNSTTPHMPAQPSTTPSPFSCSSCSDGYYCKDNACHLCTAASIIACPLTDITQCTNMADTYCNCGYDMYFDYESKMCHGCSDCSLEQVKIPCTANQDTRCEAQTAVTRHTTIEPAATTLPRPSATFSPAATTLPQASATFSPAATTLPRPSATFSPTAVTPIYSFQPTVPIMTNIQPSTSTSAQRVSQTVPAKATVTNGSNSGNNSVDNRMGDGSTFTITIKIIVPSVIGLPCVIAIGCCIYRRRVQLIDPTGGCDSSLGEPHDPPIAAPKPGSPSPDETVEYHQSKSSSRVPSLVSTPTPEMSPELERKSLDAAKLHSEQNKQVSKGSGQFPSSSSHNISQSNRAQQVLTSAESSM